MSGIKQRNTKNKDTADEPSIPIAQSRKPLSTSKFKDRTSGLNYNYEDRLSKMKVFKTTILMVILTICFGYFLYEFYIWCCNIIFDLYWHHLRGVRNLENPHFIRQLWFSNFTDLFYILLKMFIAYQIFKFVNKKLLLTYDDSEELDKYN